MSGATGRQGGGAVTTGKKRLRATGKSAERPYLRLVRTDPVPFSKETLAVFDRYIAKHRRQALNYIAEEYRGGW